jgi:hypothetical protein
VKLVDSAALEWVAKVLALSGRTSGETDFDDEHLQQVIDVSRMITGAGLNDGWISVRNVHTHVADGNLFTEFDPYTLVAEAHRRELRVWVMNADLFRQIAPVDGSISGQMIGLRVRGLELAVANVTSWSGSPLGSGGTFAPQLGSTGFSSPVPFRNLPMLLHPGGDVLLERSSATGIMVAGPATAAFHWLLWIGPRGLNPPGVA